jgi:hypothetical protein
MARDGEIDTARQRLVEEAADRPSSVIGTKSPESAPRANNTKSQWAKINAAVTKAFLRDERERGASDTQTHFALAPRSLGVGEGNIRFRFDGAWCGSGATLGACPLFWPYIISRASAMNAEDDIVLENRLFKNAARILQ